MPFAPRPLTSNPYIVLKKPYSSIWEDFKDAISGKADAYLSMTNYPLCYQDNVALLSGIGFDKTVPDLLELISPGEAIVSPPYDESGYDPHHFLQTAQLLTETEDMFVYEISGRLHFVGLIFCHTPDDVKENMAKAGFKSGDWMLDQVVFSEQGKPVNIMYGQDCPHVLNIVNDLIGRVSEVNKSFERVDEVVETTSLFNRLMREFCEDQLLVLSSGSKAELDLSSV